MIEEPPPLVFATPAERPPAEILERFRGVPTSFIVDAMGGTGALDWRIRPLVGRALVAPRSLATAARSTIWRLWPRSLNAGRAMCLWLRPEATLARP